MNQGSGSFGQLKPPRRVLIVKLSSMGDVIHALPVPCCLRASFPGVRIGWVIERRWLPLIERHPDVDEVFAVDTFAIRRHTGAWPEFGSELRRIRAFRPDWSLDLQGTLKSALLARLSGARRRAGFSRDVVREKAAGLFYNHRVRPQSLHIVDQMIDVIEALGPVERDVRFPLPLPTTAEEEAAAWLRSNRAESFAFFSPGGGWISKRWPTERYAELAHRLEQEHGLKVVLNRGPGDQALDEAFRRSEAIRALLFSGDVLRLAALLSHATLAIGGDTGPLHLAAALGRPVVALYGPTDPMRNGPYTKQSIVLRKAPATEAPTTEAPGQRLNEVPRRRGNYDRARRHSPQMLAITVDEVADACGQLLATQQTPGPAGV